MNICSGQLIPDSILRFFSAAIGEMPPFNALIHRDYSDITALQVRVYDNRLVISNGATLSLDVPIEKFKQEHTSKPFNSLIASALEFKKPATGQAESWMLDVLLACKQGDLTRSQTQAISGIKHREKFQSNYLNKLLESGLLERTMPDKPTSPNQQYRITPAGLQWLEQLEK